MKRDVLILGSGRSAVERSRLDLNDFIVVCMNHAWKLVSDTYSYWFHSGDFPLAKYPPVKRGTWVTTSEAAEPIERLRQAFPELHVSDLTFPKCVCWVVDRLQPRRIGFLGCDHDYDEDAVRRWMNAKQPGPQNNYVGFGDPAVPIEQRRQERQRSRLRYGQTSEEELSRWANELFSDLSPSHFYGHGTPDPMRVGKLALLKNFNSLLMLANQRQIQLVNFSSSEFTLLPFPKQEINDSETPLDRRLQ